MAAVLYKGRSSTTNSGTKVAVLLGMNRCGSFSLLSALQIVGVLKITLHSYPWLEVDIGKIMCPLFCSWKYGNPPLAWLLAQPTHCFLWEFTKRSWILNAILSLADERVSFLVMDTTLDIVGMSLSTLNCLQNARCISINEFVCQYVLIFIKQFRARWPWSISVLEFWLSVSSSEVPASSILRIPSPRHFVPVCGRHLQ